MDIVAASRRAAILCGLLAAWPPAGNGAQAADGGSAKVTSTAERLVPTRCRRSFAATSARRRVLVIEAVDAAPDYLPARWQSGQVLADGEWLPVDKAQAEAAADPKRPSTSRSAQSAPQSLDGQLALARWCRKNAFDEEAQVPLADGARSRPEPRGSAAGPGRRWFGGQLMTPRRSRGSAKTRFASAKAAAKEFAPQVARWERMLSAGDLKSRNEALGEIRRCASRRPCRHSKRSRSTASWRRTPTSNDVLWVSRRCCRRSPRCRPRRRRIRSCDTPSSRNSRASASPRSPPSSSARCTTIVPQLLGALTMPIESSYRRRDRRRRQRPLFPLALP